MLYRRWKSVAREGEPHIYKGNYLGNDDRRKAELKRRITKLEVSEEGSLPLNAVPDSKDTEICIMRFTPEQFKQGAPSFRNNTEKQGHSIANPPHCTSVIEALLKDPEAIEPQLQRRRHIKRHTIHPQSRGESVTSSHDIRDSIRIRSTYLLDLLFDTTGVKIDHGGTKTSVNECTSHVFLYLFSIFIIYSEEIKTSAEKL